MSGPQWERIAFQPPFFRGELLNFAGVKQNVSCCLYFKPRVVLNFVQQQNRWIVPMFLSRCSGEYWLIRNNILSGLQWEWHPKIHSVESAGCRLMMDHGVPTGKCGFSWIGSYQQKLLQVQVLRFSGWVLPLTLHPQGSIATLRSHIFTGYQGFGPSTRR